VVKLLAWFWLRRFVLVAVLVSVGLLALELARRGSIADALPTVLRWSGAAAFIAASVSTYWAYRIQCRVVFDREPPE
jgi:hypothetical protein